MKAILYHAETGTTERVTDAILPLLRAQLLTDADHIKRLRVDAPTARLLLGSPAERALANTYYAVYVARHAGPVANTAAAAPVQRLTGFSAPLYGNVLIVENVPPRLLTMEKNVARLEAQLGQLRQETAQLIEQFRDEPSYALKFNDAFTLDGSGDDDSLLGTGLQKTAAHGVELVLYEEACKPLQSCTMDQLLTILEKLEDGTYTRN